MEKVYGAILGQYSAALHAKIKGLSDYEISSSDLDIVWLIREIKKIVSGIDKKSDPRMPLIHAIETLYRMKQGATEANDNYLDVLKQTSVSLDSPKAKICFVPEVSWIRILWCQQPPRSSTKKNDSKQ